MQWNWSETHRVTADFPGHELYGLSQQMRRAAVSVPSNIAEGKGHGSDKGFSIFLYRARISART
jgi:four helix bundle protein